MSKERLHSDNDGGLVVGRYELPGGVGNRIKLPNGEVVKVERHEGHEARTTILWPTKFKAAEFFVVATSAIGIPYTEVTLRGNYGTVSQDEFAVLEYDGVSHVSLPEDRGVIGWQRALGVHQTLNSEGAMSIKGLDIDAAVVEAMMGATGSEEVIANREQLASLIVSS